MLTTGSDIYRPQFSDEELAACLDAAHRHGLRVLVHAHAVAGVEQAVRLRVDGIEHFTCLSETGAAVTDDLLAAVADAGITVDLTLGVDLALAPPLDELPPNLRALMERLGLDIPTFRASLIERAGRVRHHGIRVVTGTDAGAAPTKRHGAAWLAVVELVEAGYPVAEALATATSEAAAELGLREVTGRLRAGLSADLLVVDGDVAADPEALGRPVAVVVRGAQAS
jgi:imidazolonepropionase-like amidohydrolase